MKREFSIQAYLGECAVYQVNKGVAVTKAALLASFKQAAACFGWKLTGQLVDINGSDASE